MSWNTSYGLILVGIVSHTYLPLRSDPYVDAHMRAVQSVSKDIYNGTMTY